MPALAADLITQLPTPMTGPVPVPRLVVRGTELYADGSGTPYVRYQLRVVNAYAIPDSFFSGPYSCDPPQVSIFNGDTDAYIYGFCGGGDDPVAGQDALYNVIWFGLKKGSPPPSKVYLQLYDTKTKEKYASTTAVLPGAPPDTKNEITGVAVESVDCRPSSIAGACRSNGRLSDPALELKVRVTYNYDGGYGPGAELHLGILWAYGTCLINVSEQTHPTVGQPWQTVMTAGTDLTTVSNCASIPSITDRVYALRVCLSRGGIYNVATDCRDIPYERTVTFARE